MAKFNVYKQFDLSQINKEIVEKWTQEKTFEKSIELRKGNPAFVFYEGPPSANGKPGIHHVMARTIKDIFCRYKTQQGYQVKRKAGWDTHGLPVELSVEKNLEITKEDIGIKISVDEYNKACRENVMQYTDIWKDLTNKMGYWVDMENPYITYDNRYIETLWNLIQQLYNKNLLYKGYTIQPFSPAAGTGLSTHELNQPGCYRDVKDTTIVAQFNIINDAKSEFLFANIKNLPTQKIQFVAWTTTPWTLPSNTALAVGANISYIKVASFNQYTGEPIIVILAKDRFSAYFDQKNADLELLEYKEGDKKIPYKIISEYKGKDLEGLNYEQLIPWVKPDGKAFQVITGDFVTTEDGTGIVHIAPTFGADDDRVAKASGIVPLVLIDKDENRQPMVDKQGRFYRINDLDPKFIETKLNKELYTEYAGRYVKNAYDTNLTEKDTTLDIDLSVMLKKENKAFKVEKHEHNYPHCWRTDKPVLYYPLDSWFIKTTALKNRMVELNNTINWKPQSTGSGRFGKWLENLQDWNLSRSRYWGTPLPIWLSEDKTEQICIGSVEELYNEIEKAVNVGFMKSNPFKEKNFIVGENSKENYEKIDLHRPYVDNIYLVSKTGQKLTRELDLIDVWFDSGAMPYAQLHYPFENKELIDEKGFFPADFIAEGVDQTRGWFFTLHAISTMLFDNVAYKNIISNGLVLDKNGLKMSKRLGNGVDPFGAIEKYGSDAVRWYMVTNSQPWDNLKFDIEGVDEVKRKFFGTLYNTYSFFSLYANVDGFSYSEAEIPVNERQEIDKWIISLLNSLVKEVTENLNNYEPTRAGRAIQDFVGENLSNWYVRLNRKRYWGGDYNNDKIAAYQTLYTCLETVAKLIASIAPFYAEKLYSDLTSATARDNQSVHIAEFPKFDEKLIDKSLEERQEIAQKISSMALALRRKVSIKVRQPLQKIMVPVLDNNFAEQLKKVEDLILSEINVKELEYLTDTKGILVKKIKPNFKTLGPKFGKSMKLIADKIATLTQEEISKFEEIGNYSFEENGNNINLLLEDVEILSEDIPGWLVANEGKITVALDVNITEKLHQEGIAREFVNRIQNIRKDSGFEITDRILIKIVKQDAINLAIHNYNDYIATQTLAKEIILVDSIEQDKGISVEIENGLTTLIQVIKI